MMKSWLNVLIHPKESVIKAEIENVEAVSPSPLVWLGLAILLSTFIIALSVFIKSSLQLMGGSGTREFLIIYLLNWMSVEYVEESVLNIVDSPFFAALMSFCLRLIFTPVILLVGSGICFGLAKLFGGTGTFKKQNLGLVLVVAPF